MSAAPTPPGKQNNSPVGKVNPYLSLTIIKKCIINSYCHSRELHPSVGQSHGYQCVVMVTILLKVGLMRQISFTLTVEYPSHLPNRGHKGGGVVRQKTGRLRGHQSITHTHTHTHHRGTIQCLSDPNLPVWRKLERKKKKPQSGEQHANSTRKRREKTNERQTSDSGMKKVFSLKYARMVLSLIYT